MAKYIPKTFLLAVINLLAFTGAKAQQPHIIAIYYFKHTGNNFITKVGTLDEAEYFRVLLPPTSEDHRYNVQEYYKNGKIKLIGKILAEDTVGFNNGSLQLDDQCITYYPDGKKESMITYSSGRKNGDEYYFYPNGKIYSYIKNALFHLYTSDSKLMECYDINGEQICNNGNGKWIVYDSAYKNVKIEGTVKDGKKEGEWNGKASWPDSIKYTYIFKNNLVDKCFGYDKSGTKFEFEKEYENASFKGGPPTFIQSVRNHYKTPNNSRKAALDTMHIAFVIEKDGSLSNCDVEGSVDQSIKDALIMAMKSCRKWSPTKYYGVPFRTKIILPMKYESGYLDDDKVQQPPAYSIFSDMASVMKAHIMMSNEPYRIRVSYYEKLLLN